MKVAEVLIAVLMYAICFLILFACKGEAEPVGPNGRNCGFRIVAGEVVQQ